VGDDFVKEAGKRGEKTCITRLDSEGGGEDSQSDGVIGREQFSATKGGKKKKGRKTQCSNVLLEIHRELTQLGKDIEKTMEGRE